MHGQTHIKFKKTVWYLPVTKEG